MFDKKQFQSVLLECSDQGLFIFANRHGGRSDEEVRFSTPDGEGVKLQVLMSKLQPGDKIRLAFDDRIIAPTESEYNEWRKKQVEDMNKSLSIKGK